METGQRGDRRQDFEALVGAVADPVRRYLRRRTDDATADDVLSETLIVLWRRLDDVPDASVAWAIGVARLQLANALRAQRRQDRVARRLVPTPPPGVDDGTADAVRSTLARLRPADAEIIRLWAWEGLEPSRSPPTPPPCACTGPVAGSPSSSGAAHPRRAAPGPCSSRGSPQPRRRSR